MMAMSIQACIAASTCKQPIKLQSESPRVVHRHGKKSQPNPAHRKSAVERLEESKSHYVKSECLLDSRQEFAHSSHLQISRAYLKPPPLNHLTPKCLPLDPKRPSTRTPTQIDPRSPSSSLQNNYLSIQPIRRRARSQSEIKDPQNRPKVTLLRRSSSRSIEGPSNLEIRLKQLISSNSRDNLIASTEFESGYHSNGAKNDPRIKRGFSDPSPKEKSYPNDHKSLPDLSPVRIYPLRRREPLSSSSSSEDDFPLRKTNRPRSETFINELPSLRSSFRSKSTARIADMKSTDNLRQSLSKLELNRLQNKSESYKRRPVFRSKSDITYVKQKEFQRRRNSGTEDCMQSFFDTLGLEMNSWRQLTTIAPSTSPPKFFESTDSFDSVDCKSSYESRGSSDENNFNKSNFNLRKKVSTETSIVEKNARVVKWLFHCRKAHLINS